MTSPPDTAVLVLGPQVCDCIANVAFKSMQSIKGSKLQWISAISVN